MSKTTEISCGASGRMFFAGFIDLYPLDTHSQPKSFWIMATILNDEEIKKLITGKVISGGDPSCVKPNSYALRLGELGEFLNSGKEFKLGTTKKGIKVQPGHSVALTALEVIDFRSETVRKLYPNCDLHAFISPLTDLSREGIVAPTTQVDVGYHGTLNWTITNTSNDVRSFMIEEKLFRLTIFKLAPGETPTTPYNGDYQSKTGYIRSQRRGAPVGMKESQWEDSCIAGGPEALLENLVKSGYPWNLLGQRLQLIGGQFETVTNEFGDIKKFIEKLNTDISSVSSDVNGLRKDLPSEIKKLSSENHTEWTSSLWTTLGILIGLILTIVTNDSALRFIRSNGSVIGIVIICISVAARFAFPKFRKRS
jgi:deoxycytidine triphosphate deaminase